VSDGRKESPSSSEDRHADIDRAGSGVVACQPFERRKFLAGGVETDLESLDFAEPAIRPRLVDSVGEVAGDLDQPAPLGWRYAQHRAADTGLTEMILNASAHR
jgi:hypothetical protein